MISTESLILLNTKIIPLTYFKEEHIHVIEDIKNILTLKNPKLPTILLGPRLLLQYSLSAIALLLYFFIGFVLVAFFVDLEHGLEASREAANAFIHDYHMWGIIFSISAFIGLITTYFTKSFINERVNHLKQQPFNTQHYIDQLSDILSPYQKLKIIDLLKSNGNNLFGLIILQFIVSAMEKDTIKKSDLYFKPWLFFLKSI